MDVELANEFKQQGVKESGVGLKINKQDHNKLADIGNVTTGQKVKSPNTKIDDCIKQNAALT